MTMLKREPDPIVAEVPVFLSKGLDGQLYLLQYPLAPSQIPVQDELSMIQAQIKPEQDKIQLKVELDTDRRYSKQRGETYQSSAVGKILRPDTNLKDESNLLTERVLESVAIPSKSKSSRYVVGLVKKGQLHLTPLKSIVQMRNKCWYLNAADNMNKLAKEMEDEDDEDVAELEPTKINVKFKQTRGGGRGGGEAAKVKHPRHFNAHTKANEEEPWVELEYYHRTENEEHLKLQSKINESEIPFFVVEKAEYLRELFPKYVETQVEGTQALFTAQKPSAKITGQKSQ